MGDKSNIEWTDASWNPTTGCTQISPGCAHCYAKTWAARMKAMGQPRYQNDGGKGSGPGFALTLQPDVLELPLRWKRPRRIFVDSMSDLFHEDVPFDYIWKVYAVMAAAPQHQFQLLTKRPQRRLDMLKTFERASFQVDKASREMGLGGVNSWPRVNIWEGVTVENQHFADERIPILLDTPAAVRFLSCEPLLGPLKLRHMDVDKGSFYQFDALTGQNTDMGRPCPDVDHLDWVIVGGESGPKHRPFDPAWARSIVAQCRDAGVACFVKQLGGARPGNKLEDMPEDLRVREFPR